MDCINNSEKLPKYLETLVMATHCISGEGTHDRFSVTNTIHRDKNAGCVKPLVSIIIPIKGECDEYAVSCLKAIVEGNENKKLPIEFILVLSKHVDISGLPKKVRKNLVLLEDVDKNSFGMLNAGASVGSGDYLVFLDSHSLPRPGWLEALITAAQDENVGVVGSRWLNSRNGRIEHVGIAFYRDNGFLRETRIYQGVAADQQVANKVREVQAVKVTGMLVKQEVFQKTNGFDETLPGLEDIDFCLKVGRLDKKVICTHKANLYYEEPEWLSQEKGLSDFDDRWEGQINCDAETLLAEDGFVLHQCENRYYVSPVLKQVDTISDDILTEKNLLEENLELLKSINGKKEDLAGVCQKLIDIYFTFGSQDNVHKIQKLMQMYGLTTPVMLEKYEDLIKADNRNFGDSESVDMYTGTRFVIPIAALVSDIQIKIHKQGMPNDEIIAYIYNDHEGPSDCVSEVGSVPVCGRDITSDPNGEWIRFVFLEPVPLAANTYFWVILHRTGKANNKNYYKAVLDSSPECKCPYGSDYYGPQPSGGNVNDRISQLFRIIGSIIPDASESAG